MKNGTTVFRLIMKKGVLFAVIFLLAVSMIACSKKNNSDVKAGIKSENNAGKTDGSGKPDKAPDSKTETDKSAAGGENSQIKQEKPNKNSGVQGKTENEEAASKKDGNKSDRGQEKQKKDQADNKPEDTGKAQSRGSKGS